MPPHHKPPGLQLAQIVLNYWPTFAAVPVRWPPLTSPWDIEEGLASLCFVLVSFPHLLPIWIPSLTFIPKVVLSFDRITYSCCLPIFLWFFPLSALTLALAFLLGVSLSPSSSSLLSASLHMAFVLTYETAYPSLEWTLPYYVVFVTKYFMCIVESLGFYSM